MAKLYFRYSAMNSGKTTALIQAAYNYEERGMKVLVLKPAIDTKGGDTVITRVGLSRPVDILIKDKDSITELLAARPKVDCVLVDEASFLTPEQVEELFWYAVNENVPVLTYGLRTDFRTQPFRGASRLLALAHELEELKTICRCGKKAIFNGRKVNGKFVHEGEQMEIDDKAHIEYEALCAADYRRFVLGEV